MLMRTSSSQNQPSKVSIQPSTVNTMVVATTTTMISTDHMPRIGTLVPTTTSSKTTTKTTPSPRCGDTRRWTGSSAWGAVMTNEGSVRSTVTTSPFSFL